MVHFVERALPIFLMLATVRSMLFIAKRESILNRCLYEFARNPAGRRQELDQA